MPLERLTIYQLHTPLLRPCLKASVAVNHFSSFAAMAVFADGSRRLGECTIASGEAEQEMAREYSLLARHGRIKAFLDRNQHEFYLSAPLLTCLDPALAKPIAGQVTVCPLLECDRPSDIGERVAALALQGHNVIKVSLGPDLEAARVFVQETIQAGRRSRVRFRYDAHAQLDLAGAMRLVRWLDDATTELLEQPLPAHAWSEMGTLYDSSPVSLGLDESIRDGQDVFRAGGCAEAVHLKLSRNGSPSRILELAREAGEIGLKIILGQGMQNNLGCWLEGQIQILAGLTAPGEMTGFDFMAESPLAGLFEVTRTGFSTQAQMSLEDIECVLEKTCLRQYSIPVGAAVAHCA